MHAPTPETPPLPLVSAARNEQTTLDLPYHAARGPSNYPNNLTAPINLPGQAERGNTHGRRREH